MNTLERKHPKMLRIRKALEAFVSYNPLLAFIVTMLSFTLQEIIRGAQPFGGASTQINDQAVQFVPFAAEYRRILLGTSELSSYAWTWAAGAGVPMHGNLATYDGGLLFPLVLVLTPENKIEFAFFLITALSYAFAAAFMALLLERLYPGMQRWLLLILAAGYGLSSWALQDGSYVQMWLSGLYMLPLMALVAVHAVQKRYFFSGTAVIALAWWSNYYTAYMASLGAGLFLFYYLAVNRRPLRDSFTSLGFFVMQGILGVLTSAFSWLPTYRQVLNGIEQEGATAMWPDLFPFLGHLLPWTQSLSLSPSFALTSSAIILACMGIASRKIPVRTRIINAATIIMLVFSFAYPVTVIVWNLFDTPNGNLWRAAFVVTFFITLVAAHGASYLEQYTWHEWLSPLAVLAVLFYLSSQPGANHHFKTLFALSVFVVLAGFLVFTLVHKRYPESSTALGALFAVCIMIDFSGSNAWMLHNRDNTLFEPYPQWTPVADSELQWRDSVYAEGSSPVKRTMLGHGKVSDPSYSNKGFLLSTPTLSYYSSLIPNASLALADKLGVTAGRSPRNQSESTDFVVHGLMGTTTTLVTARSQQLLEPMPFAHLLPINQKTETPVFTGLDWKTNPKRPVFEARNNVFGTPVYREPLFLSTFHAPVALEGKDPIDGTLVNGECPAGTEVHFDGRDYEATIVTKQGNRDLYHDVTALPEAQHDSGSFSFTISADIMKPSSGLNEVDKVSCFDPTMYDALTGHKQPLTYTVDRFGAVELVFAESTTALVVLKMPVHEGYQCQSDAGPVPVKSLEGLAAVPVENTHKLTCTYTIPWQRLASSISIGSLMVSILIGFAVWKRERKRTMICENEERPTVR